MKVMTGRQRQLALAALFPLILVPAFILAYFAFGAVNQEEVIQRRRLEDNLLLELDQTNGRIEFYLEELQEQLYASLPGEGLLDTPALWAEDWKRTESLAGSVFVVSAEGEILAPELDDADETNLFYWRYLNFFAGRESIPVYQSIAEEYSGEILGDGEPTSSARTIEKNGGALSPAPESPPEKEIALDGIPPESENAFPDEIQAEAEEIPPMATSSREIAEYGAPKTPLPTEEATDREAFAYAEKSLSQMEETPASSPLRSKKAEGIFGSDPVVQERVYELAREEGQQYLERNVLPQLSTAHREEATQTVVRSVYMESTRYFQQIIQTADYGLIPRLFDSSFILMFWARRGDRIVGCELDMDAVKDQLALAVSVPANGVRYLNILDSGGEPLIPFDGKTRDQWRRPFVAKEISQWLPYWETAILLDDPEAFQRELDDTRYLLTFMISALSAMLLAAMIIVFRLSSRQMREVQQRVGFVTNVTHELKTPLTSIRLYSEMLAQSQGHSPEKVGKYAGYIARESQRLTRLIGNVLDFAKWDRGSRRLNREKTDLNILTEELTAEIREEYEKDGFSLVFRPALQPLPIDADREAVIQVILNLLSNARKYSEDEKEILMETVASGKEAVLNVSDRGIGIPRKYRKKIFREFYRVDTSLTSHYKGTGLGLAIAAHIMKNHGGRLGCTPRDRGNYRRGTRFTLAFPLAAEEGNGK